MNTNYEPAYLVIDFCREVRKQNIQDHIPHGADFDFNKGSQDRKDFMEWLNNRPEDRRFLEECYNGDENEFFMQAVSEPDFHDAWNRRHLDKDGRLTPG